MKEPYCVGLDPIYFKSFIFITSIQKHAEYIQKNLFDKYNILQLK